jgi:RNA polymerase sigma-70 factor (ECF subfamily)
MTTGPKGDEERREHESDDGSAATKATNAAVRRALVESRQELLVFLRRRLGSREEAEEVLQHFSLRALERASDLRDVRTARGWLGRVLASSIADHQRRAVRSRRREVAMDQSNIENVAVEPDGELDGAVCNCLYKLLPTLKPDYAEVVWRADILGEPRDRIAASLGTTLNNVTVRIHRGRRTLKKRLEEMCLTCPVHGFLDCRCDEAERIRRQRAETTLSRRTKTMSASR